MEKSKKSREEILEAKRRASKDRYMKIKCDPILNEMRKKKDKESYIKNKNNQKYLKINERSVQEQKNQREKWRLHSSKYYAKNKKEKPVLEVNADENIKESKAAEAEETLGEADPLKLESKEKQPKGRDVVVKVYNFLKEEYIFTMTHKSCSCDLSHLRNISRRTAEACNISVLTLAQILEQDRKTNGNNPVKNTNYTFCKNHKKTFSISAAEAKKLRQELEEMEAENLANAKEDEDLNNVQKSEINLLPSVVDKEEINSKEITSNEVKTEVGWWQETEIKTEVEDNEGIEIKQEPETTLEEEEVDGNEDNPDDYEITIKDEFIG